MQIYIQFQPVFVICFADTEKAWKHNSNQIKINYQYNEDIKEPNGILKFKNLKWNK